MPELYPDPVEGPYTVPSGTDIADGPQAFRDFADSLGGLSDTLEIVEIAGDHTATAVEMGSLFTYSGLDSPTLTITDGLAPVGSVFAVSNLSDAADSAVTVETPNLTETVGQYAIVSFTQVAVDVWIPNGGGAGGGEEPKDPTAPPDPGVFDEVAGTGGTYFDKTIDETTYRTVEFLDDGTFVLSEPGAVSWWLGSAGGSGGTYNGNGVLGAGGGHGAVWEMHDYYLPAGTYTVTIGQPGSRASAQGGATVITPETPLSNMITSFSCRGGQGGSGSAGAGPNTQYPFADATTQGGITRVTDSQPYYTGGTPGAGYGGGAAGLGGGVTGRMGGPTLTITGWGQADFDYGKGGSSQYGSDAVVVNCGYGGDGDHQNGFANGSSGRAYIRVRVVE